jgi:Sulfotransferase family
MDHRGKRVTRDALGRYFRNGGWARTVQPLPEYDCIYVRNAKVGTGTTLLWLHRAYTGDHGFVPVESIHAEHKLPSPEEVGWRHVVRMLNGGAFRFAFVRDPVRRVESAYLNKVVRHRGPVGRQRFTALQRALGLPEDPAQGLSFDQCIAALEMLAAQEPLRMDPHWRHQHLNLMHPLIEYDLIGRLESFAEDLDQIRKRTGLPEVPIELWRNVSTRPTVGLVDGRPHLLRKIRDIYARDFELYGY